MTRLSVPCCAQKWQHPVACVHLVFAVRSTSLTDTTSSQLLFAPVLPFLLLGLFFLFFFFPSSPSSSLGWLSSSSSSPSTPSLIPHSLFRLCFPFCTFPFLCLPRSPSLSCMPWWSKPARAKVLPPQASAASLLVLAGRMVFKYPLFADTA